MEILVPLNVKGLMVQSVETLQRSVARRMVRMVTTPATGLTPVRKVAKKSAAPPRQLE